MLYSNVFCLIITTIVLFFFSLSFCLFCFFFFFFQAEDGIRDGTVTGVQTCALPICVGAGVHLHRAADARVVMPFLDARHGARLRAAVVDVEVREVALEAGRARSEERRVGKECRSRGWRDHEKKKIYEETRRE